MNTIDNLNVGDVAYDNIETYARVLVCVHGHKYYANYNNDNDNDNTPYYIVSDIDDDHLSCCN